MSPVQAVRTVVRKYAVFSGRAPRSAYWWFALFSLVVVIITLAIDAIFFGTGETTTTATSATFQANAGPATLVASLALVLPTLGVAVRRLHDTDRRGWWILLGLIPLLGTVVLIVFYALDSTPGHNRFGSNPQTTGAGEQVTA